MSSDQDASIAHALEAWIQALGAGSVAHDASTLDAYARTTQAQATRPACILYPQNTEDVQAITRIAQTHRVPLYPISGGKNWGYGDACAPCESSAIVDLGRMNRILEVNTELAYCIIEPGVTQQELHDYLHENDTGLWMDAVGAGPEATLVGNAADRGFGHTRYGDHVRSACGMEIVLADGRVLRTGLGHYSNAKAAHVYPYGVGPYIDGLFTQSNFGIITQLTLHLMPAPEAFSFFYFQLKEPHDIADAVERLRPLRLNGTLQTAVHIGNDLRVIASTEQYPWAQTQETPLPPAIREQLRRDCHAQAWQGSGSITGTTAQVRASKRALRKALRGLCTPHFVNDWKLNLAEKIVPTLMRMGVGKSLGEALTILRQNYDLLKGSPSPDPLRGTHWRLRTPPEGLHDLRDDGVGLYWVAPVMAQRGADALEVQSIVEPIFHAHGFDLLISFILLTERSLVAIFNICFDQSIPAECAAASACYEESMQALKKKGYTPYRSGLQGMPALGNDSEVFWDIATDLKRALDPHDLIAPGRYIPPLQPFQEETTND